MYTKLTLQKGPQLFVGCDNPDNDVDVDLPVAINVGIVHVVPGWALKYQLVLRKSETLKSSTTKKKKKIKESLKAKDTTNMDNFHRLFGGKCV